MTYAAVVSLEQTIDLILKEDVKYSISGAEREQIDSIREYVIFIISFLENSPEKANRVEAKIRDLANEAEDLLENQMSVKQSRDEYQRKRTIVRENIGLITGDMTDDRPRAAISSPCRVAATGKIDVITGLDEDVMELAGRLRGESSKLEVIPIVGMGGIGKTTLAQKAYDCPLISEHFDIRAWITVSQDYSLDEIHSRLLDSLNSQEIDKSPTVHKCLKERRHLIVIDDVWSTEAWDGLRISFPDDNNGSRIMLTTRLPDVAAYSISEGKHVHEMKPMNENQSWNLLKGKVFTNGQDCSPELEYIGREIARACKGLPLAVVLVAGMLPAVGEVQASWMEIAKNVKPVVNGELEMILSLTYMRLPHHLRACFLYIGGFPEDYEIPASRLIKLWVAEGFLRHDKNGCKSLEKKAEDCLEDLVKRSLVLVTRRKATGEIKSCSLHDLVRDSCIRIAQQEKFLLHVNSETTKKERRISCISHYHFNEIEIQGPSIHTLLCLRPNERSSLPDFIGSFRLLRVLDVVCSYLALLPAQLFELIHLRYLALGTPDQEIPAAISNLQNLQTLIINPKGRWRYNYFISNLPLEIWRMQQLRHLVLSDRYLLLNPIDGSTLPLENLQTFSGAIYPACCQKILEMMPNLKKLRIHFRTPEVVDHHVLNLIFPDQLEKLKLSTYNRYYLTYIRTRAFPMTLKKLSLVDIFLYLNDISVIGSLPGLQVLKLKNRDYSHKIPDTWETTDAEFPQLRFLLIHDCRLAHWITESSSFPRLECLMLRSCHRLRAIPDGFGEISTLELIDVVYGTQSLADSAKQIQKTQQDNGNDTLQVRCTHVLIDLE